MYRSIVLFNLLTFVLGLQNAAIQTGHSAHIESFPHAAYLYIEVQRPISCGASLIMIQAVLTAAHCVNEIREGGSIHAFFGAAQPLLSTEYRKVVSYKINPHYNEANGENNLAVAYLEKSVPLQNNIKLIPLAVTRPSEGTTLFSVGWGKRQTTARPTTSVYRKMRAVRQLLQGDQFCITETKYKYLSPATLCTEMIFGMNFKDDAGNGLIVSKPKMALVGVLSFVLNDKVNVYTSVGPNRNWIMYACKVMSGLKTNL